MSASLPMVEGLLQEFYQPATPNARKRDIETQLLTFKSQPNAWQLCLQVATTIDGNQFLWFFATSTLEHTITRRWTHLTNSDRVMLRDTLWNTYANLSLTSVPRRQRDTFAQLIATMGKREFPDDHPNYVVHCMELIKTKFPLGICLLRTTSEEVVSNREDVTTERKNYFHSCISMCIPDVMDLLTKYLLIIVCYLNEKDIHSLPNTIIDYTLIATLPNDNHLSTSVLELLTCVQHLVSWIRTDLISEYFLMSILDLSQCRAQYQDISLSALSVLNELLYLQKPLPYAMTLMSGINGLLEQHIAAKQQSEMYGDKFRELLRLYTNKYAQKLLQENELLEVFLKSLYSCTIQRNGALDFTEKLEIWTPIIKGLVQNSKLNCYNDIIHQLVAEIMRRILFEYNKTELELLDNEVLEDNTQTEWQQYLTQCIECISLVAETHPNVVFGQVYSQWSRPYMYLMSFENAIDAGKHNEVLCKVRYTRFTETVRDFSTVCQAVVRIAPLLDLNSEKQNYTEMSTHLQLLTEHLLISLKFLVSNKLMTIDVDRSLFQSDLDYLYAQILMAIRSILPLLSINIKSEELLHTLFESLGSIFLTPTVVIAPIVYMAASQLLLCLSSVIRPRCLLETTAIVSLMQAGPRLAHLPRQVVANIYISLISYLVLPWKNVEEQDYTRRGAVLREYVDSLAQNFIEVDLNASESKIAAVTVSLLNACSLVIEFFRDSSNAVKDMLAGVFKAIITKALMIYNNYGLSSNTIAITVAEFSLSILRTLQSQLGANFIKEMITLFITVSSREPLSMSRIAVTEKILQMFQLIVEQPGSASLSMLPSILDFTIEQILSLLQQETAIANNSEITSIVYALFDSVLQCKWQYFYKSQVQHNGSLASPHTQICDNLHPTHFMAIMNAYGQTLVTGCDPSNVRNVLCSMQNVNERWRLYQRALFKEHLLGSFQGAVINLLLSGEGALHYDLLANALFAMGQVDTLKLRDSFANAGFPVNLKTIDEICFSTDIPTFSQKLSQLIQDAHCVHMTQQT